MFTRYSFVIDLNQSEDQLMANLKSKTRYNVRLAQTSGVTVTEDNSKEAFEDYIRLWKQTTRRQAFYAHDETYHRKMWTHMRRDQIAHLLKAVYQGETLAVWIVFVMSGVLYYPYGASSRKHKDVMANNLLAWEAIRFGKGLGCHRFDMWGSLGPNPDQKDPWYGFHRFKEGYGGQLMEFVGTYDYVADPQRYLVFTKIDNLRWKFLRLRSKLPF
jgi:lipid II:glycine glycyltransferase (peptidoglycan interpeptide bridge formation enzyme)